MESLSFESHPDRYRHWKLAVDGDVATLTMDVEPRKGSTPYASTGNKPIIGLCLLILAGFWLRNRANL